MELLYFLEVEMDQNKYLRINQIGRNWSKQVKLNQKASESSLEYVKPVKNKL